MSDARLAKASKSPNGFEQLFSNRPSGCEKNYWYKFSRIHKHSTEMSGEEWRKLTQTVSSLNSLATLQIHDQSA